MPTISINLTLLTLNMATQEAMDRKMSLDDYIASRIMGEAKTQSSDVVRVGITDSDIEHIIYNGLFTIVHDTNYAVANFLSSSFKLAQLYKVAEEYNDLESWVSLDSDSRNRFAKIFSEKVSMEMSPFEVSEEASVRNQATYTVKDSVLATMRYGDKNRNKKKSSFSERDVDF